MQNDGENNCFVVCMYMELDGLVKDGLVPDDQVLGVDPTIAIICYCGDDEEKRCGPDYWPSNYCDPSLDPLTKLPNPLFGPGAKISFAKECDYNSHQEAVALEALKRMKDSQPPDSPVMKWRPGLYDHDKQNTCFYLEYTVPGDLFCTFYRVCSCLDGCDMKDGEFLNWKVFDDDLFVPSWAAIHVTEGNGNYNEERKEKALRAVEEALHLRRKHMEER